MSAFSAVTNTMPTPDATKVYLDQHKELLEVACGAALNAVMAERADDPLHALARHLQLHADANEPRSSTEVQVLGKARGAAAGGAFAARVLANQAFAAFREATTKATTTADVCLRPTASNVAALASAIDAVLSQVLNECTARIKGGSEYIKLLDKIIMPDVFLVVQEDEHCDTQKLHPALRNFAPLVEDARLVAVLGNALADEDTEARFADDEMNTIGREIERRPGCPKCQGALRDKAALVFAAYREAIAERVALPKLFEAAAEAVVAGGDTFSSIYASVWRLIDSDLSEKDDMEGCYEYKRAVDECLVDHPNTPLETRMCQGLDDRTDITELMRKGARLFLTLHSRSHTRPHPLLLPDPFIATDSSAPPPTHSPLPSGARVLVPYGEAVAAIIAHAETKLSFKCGSCKKPTRLKKMSRIIEKSVLRSEHDDSVDMVGDVVRLVEQRHPREKPWDAWALCMGLGCSRSRRFNFSATCLSQRHPRYVPFKRAGGAHDGGRHQDEPRRCNPARDHGWRARRPDYRWAASNGGCVCDREARRRLTRLQCMISHPAPHASRCPSAPWTSLAP